MAPIWLRIMSWGRRSEGFGRGLPYEAFHYQCRRDRSQDGWKGPCPNSPTTVGTFWEQIFGPTVVWLHFVLSSLDFCSFALYGWLRFF